MHVCTCMSIVTIYIHLFVPYIITCEIRYPTNVEVLRLGSKSIFNKTAFLILHTTIITTVQVVMLCVCYHAVQVMSAWRRGFNDLSLVSLLWLLLLGQVYWSLFTAGNKWRRLNSPSVIICKCSAFDCVNHPVLLAVQVDSCDIIRGTGHDWNNGCTLMYRNCTSSNPEAHTPTNLAITYRHR